MDRPDPYSSPSPRDGVEDAVAAAYGLWVTSTLSCKLGGAINHVLRVSTQRGDVVVRVHRPETTPARLLAVHRIQNHLRTVGLPIPAVLRTRDGASWIRFDGRLVEVLEYVPSGHEVATWRDGEAIVFELGRLHAGLRTVDARGLPRPVFECYATPATALELLADTEAGFRSQAEQAAYPQAAATRASTLVLLRHLESARRAYGNALPRALIHGDYVGNNALVAGDRVVAIFDFDRLAVGDRIVEMARTLMYILSQVVYPRFGNGTTAVGLSDHDLVAVARLIGRYVEAAGWRLTPAEYQALPFEMAGAPLFPIVTAGAEPALAVAETLIFAPHVPMSMWLAAHARRVSEVLQERAQGIP